MLALVPVVILGAIAFSQVSGGDEQGVSGWFTLKESVDYQASDPATCFGSGGYDDIRGGLAITVRDGSGTVIATGALDTGLTDTLTMDGIDPRTLEEMGITEMVDPRLSLDIWCWFPIAVDHVPHADFYSVAVGRRGEITYSHQEMEQQDWSVALTLGG